MATSTRPPHHLPSAPVSPAAPTATPRVQPHPYQTTARRAQPPPAAVHVNDTASPEAATELSSIAVAPAVDTAMTPHHAVPQTRKTFPPTAPAATVLLSVAEHPEEDEEAPFICLPEKERKKPRKCGTPFITPHFHVAKLLFLPASSFFSLPAC